VSTVVVVEGRRLLLRAAVVGGIGSRGLEPARRGRAAQEPEHEPDGHAAEPFGQCTAEGTRPTGEPYRTEVEAAGGEGFDGVRADPGRRRGIH
jgi:hypothetical protein